MGERVSSVRGEKTFKKTKDAKQNASNDYYISPESILSFAPLIGEIVL
jgi:hypothetical protein